VKADGARKGRLDRHVEPREDIGMNAGINTLRDRGFIQQVTAEGPLKELMEHGPVTYYVGFDPTASSLHAGSLMPIMAMRHLQLAGHRPIALIGGGTTLIGDPSGKTEMRKMLSPEEIESNGQKILSQLRRYLPGLQDGRSSAGARSAAAEGLFLNNADWLRPLNYIEFLRDVGVYFRVNEMIKSESYRLRLEREEGLSFIEFNYQLLQAYDFLYLFDEHACTLQMGGDDQWGNILSGTELIRRKRSKRAFGLTFPLLSTASGTKMGKTADGAVWLDADKTSPYDFYQYWINYTGDAEVERNLMYFTLLPVQEARELAAAQGSKINQAKHRLAYEATRLAHGDAAADAARAATVAAFGDGTGASGSADLAAIPFSTITRERLREGVELVQLLVDTKLASSRSEARKLIEQGGAYVNGQPAQDVKMRIEETMIESGAIMLRHGKKKFHRLLVQ